MKSTRGTSRRSGRLAIGMAATLVFAITAFVLATASSARVGARPTVTGNPIVGETLTSSSAGDSAVYHWQRCNPAATTCADTDANDSNWNTIGGANGQTYTLTLADLGFFVRVIAKGTSLGEGFSSSPPVGPVTLPPSSSQQPGQLPLTPIHGVQVLAEPADGTVPQVKPPGQAGFSPFTGLGALPFGTVVDTRGSKIRLVGATGDYGNQTPDQSLEAYDGLFKLKQSPALDSDTILRLNERLGCGKGAKSSVASAASAGDPVAFTARRRRRRLWGSGSGSYSTAGAGGTGSVRGTTWVQKENCDKTVWRVTEGIGITVDPKGPKKDIELGPGDKFVFKH